MTLICVVMTMLKVMHAELRNWCYRLFKNNNLNHVLSVPPDSHHRVDVVGKEIKYVVSQHFADLQLTT